MYDQLKNAPPRLSDLRGEELRIALRDRHEANERRWLENRQPKSFPQRMADVLIRSWQRKGEDLAA